MKFSVIIPAHNEEACIGKTVLDLFDVLCKHGFDFEILVVDDHCTDSTRAIIMNLSDKHPELKLLTNRFPVGFGFAVRTGFNHYSGDAVAIVMADNSDLPQDVAKFFLELEKGYDCIFGSRFIKGGETIGYPKFKWVVNRLANFVIRVIFGIKYNDVTNAFKVYRRETIDGLKPFLSHHFNLTVELPLKSIIRGYSYTVLPNSWTNRKAGASKLKLKEMGSRYLFIILYALIEKWLAVGDYKKDKQRKIKGDANRS